MENLESAACCVEDAATHPDSFTGKPSAVGQDDGRPDGLPPDRRFSVHRSRCTTQTDDDLVPVRLPRSGAYTDAGVLGEDPKNVVPVHTSLFLVTETAGLNSSDSA